MKIRHPKAITALAWIGARVVRCWMATVRYRYHALGPAVEPSARRPVQKCIYAFWHENMLLLANQYGGLGNRVLISQHADGQLIAEMCGYLGFEPIRGSTTRGGVEAVRRIVREGQAGSLIITPDGPRGPRRQVQRGLVYLAAHTGLPIVPVGLACPRPWRMKSWDRFVLPRPFSRAICLTAEPIVVPADADKEQLEYHRQQVETDLTWLSEAAEHWAETRQLPQTCPGSHRPPGADVNRKAG